MVLLERAGREGTRPGMRVAVYAVQSGAAAMAASSRNVSDIRRLAPTMAARPSIGIGRLS